MPRRSGGAAAAPQCNPVVDNVVGRGGMEAASPLRGSGRTPLAAAAAATVGATRPATATTGGGSGGSRSDALSRPPTGHTAAAAAAAAAVAAVAAANRRHAVEAAARRYAKRFIVLGDFWWTTLRHAVWRKSFRLTIEVASAYAAATEDGDAVVTVTYDQLNAAFWNAASFPPFLHIGVAAVDDGLRRVFTYFDADADDAIDYRDLLAALALFQVPILEPVGRLVRAWLRAYDIDAAGGASVAVLTAALQTLCIDAPDRSAVHRCVAAGVPALAAAAAAARATDVSLSDRMAKYANATRLARRMGPEYVKTALPAGDEPPHFLPLVWSPFDDAIMARAAAAARLPMDVIVRWLLGQKELCAVLRRLRLANTHETCRATYEAAQEAQRSYAAMLAREKETAARADRHLRAVRATKAMEAWGVYLARNAVMRRHVTELRKWRAVTTWRRRTVTNADGRAKAARAWEFWHAHFVRRMWGYWLLYRRVEVHKRAVAASRAAAFHTHALLRKGWDSLHAAPALRRAEAHYVTGMLRRHLTAWAHVAVPAPATADGGSRGGSRRSRVAHSGVTTTAHDVAAALAAQSAEAVAAAAAAAHAAEFAAYAAAAAAEADARRWEAERAKARAVRANKRLLEAQEAARRAWKATLRVRRRAAFDAQWEEKIAAAVAAEKASQYAWITSPAGEVRAAAETQGIMFAKGLPDCKQELSDFVARVDLHDGCIHFARPGDASLVPPRPAMDFNIDAMKVREARLVAECHYAARKAVELRSRMREQRGAEWDNCVVTAAADMVVHAWQARARRLAALASLRDGTELLADPYSGELYYLIIDRGVSLAYPMRLLGDIFLLHPPPDWRMAVVYGADGAPRYSYHRVPVPRSHFLAVLLARRRERRAAADAATGRGAARRGSTDGAAPYAGSPPRSPVAGSPQRSRTSSVAVGGAAAAPRSRTRSLADAVAAAAAVDDAVQELPEPPPGYVMCDVCAVDFACRECSGDGCDGTAYCWSCFNAYHPRDAAEWAPHWDVAVARRVYVKPGGVPSRDEAALMKGCKPRLDVHLRGGSSVAAAARGGAAVSGGAWSAAVGSAGSAVAGGAGSAAAGGAGSAAAGGAGSAAAGGAGARRTHSGDLKDAMLTGLAHGAVSTEDGAGDDDDDGSSASGSVPTGAKSLPRSGSGSSLRSKGSTVKRVGSGIAASLGAAVKSVKLRSHPSVARLAVTASASKHLAQRDERHVVSDSSSDDDGDVGGGGKGAGKRGRDSSALF